ncbi:M24 family metallopeptidase [Ochrobactrum soli]|uniref:Aminopeptidase YpdF (MP-, MA-, MS-, AP-, NP-specific) n=1 Tax=Ochrobactrum soli TaxID=2448455 RepID=A0A2P9HKS0_9HYPH|nr:Xaa-Pro peptidase family protein [[Ochrobactrum] soli]SPL64744.1 Aminopeptidase YpdF (MP-, MA-, MS-, AP-, NP-specific) [[Ochrobactrum] soli]
MLLHEERLHAMMTKHYLAAIVATSPENVLYSSGFWCLPQWIRRGPQAFALLTSESTTPSSIVITGTSTLDLLADQDVQTKVRRFGSFTVDIEPSAKLDTVSLRQEKLFKQPDEGNALDALVAEIRSLKLTKARIGIDEVGLLPGDMEKLQGKLPDVTWITAAAIFRWIRAIKTTEEIERLATIGAITERSITAALAIAGVGVTERDFARAFHCRTIVEDGFPVLGCIGFGERSALMNVQPSDRRLEDGDIIRFDVGGHFKHYRADIARNVSFGEPSQDIQTKYNALNRGVQRGIEQIRPGIVASKIFDIVVDTVRKEGIPHYQRSHVGHGIGLDGYDLPLLSAGSGDILEEGMVLCIETPYYELGHVGLQVEDMLVVRSTGAEMLTNNGESLMVL